MPAEHFPTFLSAIFVLLADSETLPGELPPPVETVETSSVSFPLPGKNDDAPKSFTFRTGRRTRHAILASASPGEVRYSIG